MILVFICHIISIVILQIELPAPGKSILVHLPPSDPQLPPTSIVLQSPAPPLELPHSDYSLRLMFVWLGVDIVVQLFTCLLLENQILLRSTGEYELDDSLLYLLPFIYISGCHVRYRVCQIVLIKNNDLIFFQIVIS